MAAFMVAVAGAALCGCGDEDNFNAGFLFQKPTSSVTAVYANTVSDTVAVQSLGPWQIDGSADWCTISQTSGKGSSFNVMQVSFLPNSTGKGRMAQFTIRDTNHPNEAYASWVYFQYATRGDGSLGDAALVKTITSSDGWSVSISYDQQSRPVNYRSLDPKGREEQVRITYDEAQGRLTVQTAEGSNDISGVMAAGYQAETLTGKNDTIGYGSQYYSNGMPVSANYAFNFESSWQNRRQVFAYLLNGQSLLPDSLHCADSLRYYRQTSYPLSERLEQLKLEYSQWDNRCQSVDVNQLLLGMDEMHPLQLLSLFRLTRSTSIIRRATSDQGTIVVDTELNADKSVRRMVVTGMDGKDVTYDFTY